MKHFFKRNSRSFIMKWLSGFGRAMNRIYENRNHRVESNGELTVLKKIAETNPKIIFDGGANQGTYSKLAAELNPEALIYAFEPVETTFQKLESNIHNWGLKNIQVTNLGLYSSNQKKEIHLFSSSTHSSLFELKGVPYDSKSKIEITLVSGDHFMQTENIASIDFLKLDLEGAEYEALLGFEKALASGKIKCIQFEYGYINISAKKLLIDFYELLEKYNYLLGKIYPKYVDFRKYEFKHEDFIGPNFLAVLNSEKELINRLKKG